MKKIRNNSQGHAGARPYLGLEIGGTKLQMVLGDAAGAIHERWRFNVAREKGADGIREQIKAVLPELVREFSVAAIGVGFGGPVDWRTGNICCSHQIEGWSEFPLSAWLAEISGKPVRVDNDANVGALGEACCGAGRGFDPAFYVTLGSGVGGGLVTNGLIYHGATPGEVEIGHVRLDKQGTIVEARCSGWAVDAKIRRRLKATSKERGARSNRGREQRSGALTRFASGAVGGEARFLAPALAAGDPAAHAIVEETTEDLGFALSHVVHLLHPQVVVLGGGLALLGEPLREAVARQLPRFLMAAFQPGPQVRLAALGEDAVPAGALVLAGG